MTYCDHGIPRCDECEQSRIAWAEELQAIADDNCSLSRTWEVRVLIAVAVASFAAGGWALAQIF